MYGHLCQYRCFLLVNTFLCMTLLSGCAITKNESSVSMGWKKPQWISSLTSDSSENEASLEETVADSTLVITENVASTDNPFQEDASTSKTPEPQAPASDANVKVASSNSTFDWKNHSASSSSPGLDEATLLLVQEEFKDASREECEKWYQIISKIPPDLIPQILETRRLANNSSNMPAPQRSRSQEDRTNFKVASGTQTLQLGPKEKTTDYSPQSNPMPSYRSRSQYPNPSVDSRRSSQPSYSENRSGQNVNYVNDSNNYSQNPNNYAQNDAYQNASFDPTNPPPITTAQVQNPISNTNSQEYFEKLDQFIAVAEQRVASLSSTADKDEYLSSHAYLRMLYLMANQQERAIEAIPNTNEADQEFWQKMFWAMSNYFDTEGIPNASDRATHTNSRLTAALETLRQQSNLEIRNVNFCTKIDGFGAYDRFERAEFYAGQEVLIYAEMRNFQSESTPSGQFRTALQSTVEIHRSGAYPGLVESVPFAPSEDFCQNLRTDFNTGYQFFLPKKLTAGPYVLKLIVEDQLKKKVASYTTTFTIK